MNNFARPGLGATELPPVNADDNGKVLGVYDGAWAKVAASGGSDLPDDPAEDGTYNLQNTVSSGTSTLSWASGGSGGGVLVATDTDGTLDKTWQEIHDSTVPVLIHSGTGWFPVIQAEQDALLGTYSVGVIAIGNDGVTTLFYDAASSSEYPARQTLPDFGGGDTPSS